MGADISQHGGRQLVRAVVTGGEAGANRGRRNRQREAVQFAYTSSGRSCVFRAGPGHDDKFDGCNHILPAVP